jgi:hypothetical protein
MTAVKQSPCLVDPIPASRSLGGDVLMPVEDDLRAERGMPGHPPHTAVAAPEVDQAGASPDQSRTALDAGPTCGRGSSWLLDRERPVIFDG